MDTTNLKQQLRKVSSVGTVVNGKLVGEYDFEHYLAAFEGKEVGWTLELVADSKYLLAHFMGQELCTKG